MATVRRPGPYTLEINYAWSGLSHSFSVNCDTIGDAVAGTPADEVEMKAKSGTEISLAEFANDLWGVVRAGFHSTTLASTYTLWKRNIHNAKKVFISAGGLTSPNGSNTSLNVASGQWIGTWRSNNGSVLKINLLEGYVLAGPTIPLLADTQPWVGALNTYMQSDECCAMGLDRGFAVAAGNSNHGQNEKIFVIRNRH